MHGHEQELDTIRSRLNALELAAWRVLELVYDGSITASEGRFIGAAADAVEALEAALTEKMGKS